MAIEEYRVNKINELIIDSESKESTLKEEFLLFATDLLKDSEEIEEFNYINFVATGSRQRKIQVDGYGYNELDNCLNLFICPNISRDEMETLTRTEAESFFKSSTLFLEDINYILDNCEESSPGYGLAIDIKNAEKNNEGPFKDIEKCSIYIISDKVISKTIKFIDNITIKNLTIEFHIWDISRLYELENSASGKEDIVIDIQKFGFDGIPYIESSRTEDYEGYLCNIPGMIVAKLYNAYGSRLLEGNVRSFLQLSGKVNKGIRLTILNNPTKFFAYNNGIAATAHGIKKENGKIIEITGLQIVNGGQTTASLALALLKDQKYGSEESISKIYVPMKLSLVTPAIGKELIPNISRFANSQNKVSDSDLSSNHPFHIRMEEFSRRLLAPATHGKQYGTYWYYERASGQYRQSTYKSSVAEKKSFENKNPKNQMFKKTDLAKYINIFQRRPDIASAGGQKSFNLFTIEMEKKWTQNDTQYNEGYFEFIVALMIIFQESDRIVRTRVWYNSYKANIVAYTMALIFETVEIKYPKLAISFKNIWQKQELSLAWKVQIEQLSKKVHEFLTSEKREVENVTEWAKRLRCWDLAKKIDFEFEKSFIDELLDKEIIENQKKYAKKEQKMLKSLNFEVEVAKLGEDGWRELIIWAEEHNTLDENKKDLINVALNGFRTGKFPSEKQCKKLIDILHEANDDGFEYIFLEN